MNRSLIRLRRALFGVSCAAVFGFGATEAAASRAALPGPPACPARPYEYVTATCNAYCNGPGFCATYGYCQCGPLP